MSEIVIATLPLRRALSSQVTLTDEVVVDALARNAERECGYTTWTPFVQHALSQPIETYQPHLNIQEKARAARLSSIDLLDGWLIWDRVAEAVNLLENGTQQPKSERKEDFCADFDYLYGFARAIHHLGDDRFPQSQLLGVLENRLLRQGKPKDLASLVAQEERAKDDVYRDSLREDPTGFNLLDAEERAVKIEVLSSIPVYTMLNPTMVVAGFHFGDILYRAIQPYPPKGVV
jgi:hypothetical protein